MQVVGATHHLPRLRAETFGAQEARHAPFAMVTAPFVEEMSWLPKHMPYGVNQTPRAAAISPQLWNTPAGNGDGVGMAGR